MIIKRNIEYRGPQLPMIEMLVVVPAGVDQYQQFLDAIDSFENAMTARLGGSFNPALRALEADELATLTGG